MKRMYKVRPCWFVRLAGLIVFSCGVFGVFEGFRHGIHAVAIVAGPMVLLGLSVLGASFVKVTCRTPRPVLFRCCLVILIGIGGVLFVDATKCALAASQIDHLSQGRFIPAVLGAPPATIDWVGSLVGGVSLIAVGTWRLTGRRLKEQ